MQQSVCISDVVKGLKRTLGTYCHTCVLVSERLVIGDSLKSYQVPPSPADRSRMTKLRQLLRLIRSIAVHMPEIPAPMMTTATLE